MVKVKSKSNLCWVSHKRKLVWNCDELPKQIRVKVSEEKDQSTALKVTSACVLDWTLWNRSSSLQFSWILVNKNIKKCYLYWFCFLFLGISFLTPAMNLILTWLSPPSWLPWENSTGHISHSWNLDSILHWILFCSLPWISPPGTAGLILRLWLLLFWIFCVYSLV